MQFRVTNAIQITEKDVDDFQRRNSVALPPEYRDFLLVNKCGRMDQHLTRVDKIGIVVVNDFFGLGVERYNDIESNLDVYAERIPVGFLPFACDPGGNLFLLGLEDDTRDQVYFWDHENEPHHEAVHWRDFPNIYKVSNTFQEFLNSLFTENQLVLTEKLSSLHKGMALNAMQTRSRLQILQDLKWMALKRLMSSSSRRWGLPSTLKKT